MRLDLDEQGRPVGLDIDHAPTTLDLETLDAVGLPLQPATPARPTRSAAAPLAPGPIEQFASMRMLA